MNGAEFKQMLVDEKVRFVSLANYLKITPSSLQSRFYSRSVSADFIADVEAFLGKPSGYFLQKYSNIVGNPTNNTIPQQAPTNNEESQLNQLISLCQRQSEQISDLLARQERLLNMIENKNQA